MRVMQTGPRNWYALRRCRRLPLHAEFISAIETRRHGSVVIRLCRMDTTMWARCPVWARLTIDLQTDRQTTCRYQHCLRFTAWGQTSITGLFGS